MVFEARAAEFGLQQQPRPAAVTPAAAAPRPPAAAAAAAGDHGDCGAYSVSILRQGGRLYPESRRDPSPLPAVPSNSLLPTLSQSPAVGVDGRSQPTPIVTGRPQNS